MSGTLRWEPASRVGESLPVDLKWKLQKRYSFPVELDECDIAYLQGLADAEVDGAKDLIEIIESNGRVRLSITY